MINKWSEEELQYLRDNHDKMSDEEIGRHLGRTESGVTTKRKRIGLTHTNRKYDWNDVLKAFSKTDYILLSDKDDYKDSATNSLRYICPRHKDKGIQSIALKHLLDGRGCFYCGREITGKKKTLEFDEEYYKQLCDERNFTYVGADRIKGLINIKFICNKHPQFGVQHQTIYNLKKGYICKYCKESNYERYIAMLLKKWGYRFTSQKRFKDCKDINTLPFDYYLDDFNTIIEYDGEGHYFNCFGEKSFESTKKHDLIKDNYCKENEIDIIRIPYWESDNLEYYLFDQLVNHNVIELIS